MGKGERKTETDTERDGARGGKSSTTTSTHNYSFRPSQSFSNEVQSHSQCLTSLNEMSRDLINDHHSNDDTHDLQDTMDDLNLRWKKIMQRYNVM